MVVILKNCWVGLKGLGCRVGGCVLFFFFLSFFFYFAVAAAAGARMCKNFTLRLLEVENLFFVEEFLFG